MSKSRIKRLLATAAAVVAVTGLGVAVPEAAYAAGSPACTSFRAYNNDGTYNWHTPTSSGGSRGCYMQGGSNGIAVVVLQESLVYCFQQNIVIDGSFGNNTKAALKNAQSYLNSIYGNVVAVDGEYGPQTASWWADAKYRNGGGPVNGGWAACVVHLGSL